MMMLKSFYRLTKENLATKLMKKLNKKNNERRKHSLCVFNLIDMQFKLRFNKKSNKYKNKLS